MIGRLRSAIAVCALTGLLLPLPAAAQRGGITLPMDLEELTRSAATIVRGRVISVHHERHPELTNLDTLVVTLRVDTTLKGEPGETLTFRQYVWDIRDTWDLAGYKKGQELLLLLTQPSSVGLSAPVGLEQGRFRIERLHGKARALNGSGNARLLQGIAQRPEKLARVPTRLRGLVQQHRAGPLELDDLEEMIRSFARAD